MFDVLVAAAPRIRFASEVTAALREARLRIVACELEPRQRPPSTLRMDVAVACAATSADVGAMATGIRAALDGPPPVVGVTPGAAVPPAGTVDVLRDDVPRSLLVARVHRAAVASARERSRSLLSGRFATVRPRELLASLASRRQTCLVRIQSGARHAELELDEGAITRAHADGAVAATIEAVLAALDGWDDATFDVQATALSSNPRGPSSAAVGAPVSLSASALGASGSDVALAAAVMNAVAGYARTFLPSETVVRHLERSRELARQIDPGIDAFSVSAGGAVSITRVQIAQATSPRALSAWCLSFFQECAGSLPERFEQRRIPGVLGGLARLVEKVGWDEAVARPGGAS